MAKTQIPDDLGQPIRHDPQFKGPLKHRSCTDILCLMLFLFFIGCWAGIAIYAFTSGDPNTLLVPKDSAGGRCGLDSHVKDKPYLFFFDLTKCFAPEVPFTGCPTPQVCVAECPSDYMYFDSNVYAEKAICTYDVKPEAGNLQKMIEEKKCAKWYLPSTPIQKRCIPILNKTLIVEMAGQIESSAETIMSSIKNVKALSQAQEVGQNVVNDLINSWWKILIGVGIALVVCLLYILIMRWVAAVLVWTSLLGGLALLIGAVYFSTKRYIDLKNDKILDDDGASKNIFESYYTKQDVWLVLLIISASLLAIVLLMLIFLRNRILLAIALIKEGSKAVSSVTSVLIFPIFPWLLQCAVIAFAICVALFLSTTGKPEYQIKGMTDGCPCPLKNGTICIPEQFTTNNCLKENSAGCAGVTCKFITMDNPALYPYLQTINVVGFLWGTFFVSAMGQMILATVFATWYWTLQKSNLPFFAVTSATFTTLRYHIGTLAFGSLIITICRIIRIILEYIDHKLKKYDNGFVKAILCCCKCFFWCLERFLKFINRNAYIMCAIHGKNFCTSAKDAFTLLMRNILRVFVLDKVTDFLFFLGKLMIVLGAGAIAYILFATDLTTIDNSGLNYEIVPVIVIMIITYIIATVFFSVYSMAVDTLFLCFLEDCERNDGSSEKPYFMTKSLMNVLGKKNKTH